MDTIPLERILCSDSRAKSVVPRDGLPGEIDTYPTAFVCNTHDRDKSGQHWIAIYIATEKSGEYFDSFGLPPLH